MSYTNLPTGLWTVNLTIEVIRTILYKISLTILQALKSYPFLFLFLITVIIVIISNYHIACLGQAVKVRLGFRCFCGYPVCHRVSPTHWGLRLKPFFRHNNMDIITILWRNYNYVFLTLVIRWNWASRGIIIIMWWYWLIMHTQKSLLCGDN